MLQLDLFHEYTEVEVLELEIRSLKKSQDKLRKALFARHGELAKRYCDLQDRLDIVERNICKGFMSVK